VSDVVYHFTCSARLPWILRDGELRPGPNAIRAFPKPDFLSATTLAQGDRSASGMTAPAYRQGIVRLVRFTLDASDFDTWPDITSHFPKWTADHVKRLEAAAKESNPADWRCRAEPLPRARWQQIDTRSYRDNRWRPLREPTVRQNGNALAVTVEGVTTYSVQKTLPTGARSYTVWGGR
jgi:hypothetical protein